MKHTVIVASAGLYLSVGYNPTFLLNDELTSHFMHSLSWGSRTEDFQTTLAHLTEKNQIVIVENTELPELKHMLIATKPNAFFVFHRFANHTVLTQE